MLDCVHEAKNLLNRLDMGHMRGVAYDTAWVARLANDSGKPLFPESIKWLIAHQKEDGSWGGDVEYYHDRVVSTLSSLLALEKSKKKIVK